MRNAYQPFIIVGLAAIAGTYLYFDTRGSVPQRETAAPSSLSHHEGTTPATLKAKFDMLRNNGNSTCSATFKDSVASGSSGDRLQGSCCSPMDLHRYTEQVGGLRQYAHIPEIPPDPYDIDAELARQLIAYYDVELMPEEQRAYDYAMANSNEKGPCCCKCWRWYVYGGLGKLLIQKYGFSGEQVTEIWNFSDGCGGAGDHVH